MSDKCLACSLTTTLAGDALRDFSVRGFLAGVVRKKLGLHLMSEPGESGCVYRIIGETKQVTHWTLACALALPSFLDHNQGCAGCGIVAFQRALRELQKEKPRLPRHGARLRLRAFSQSGLRPHRALGDDAHGDGRPNWPVVSCCPSAPAGDEDGLQAS